MKKIIMLIIIICLTLSACSKKLDPPHEVAEERMRIVVEAINNNDKEALKSIFSELAISEADNLDENIDLLLSTIDNDIIHWKNDMLTPGEMRLGNKNGRILQYWYLAETKTEKYFFFFQDFDYDRIDPSNEGVQILYLLIGRDQTPNGTLVDKMVPGVTVSTGEEMYWSKN